MKLLKVNKFSEIEKKEFNPFITESFEMSIKKKKITMKIGGRRVIDAVTGEEMDTKVIAKYKEVETEEFIKIYRDQLKNVLNLSKTGMKVLCYFMEHTKKDSDEVYLYMKELLEYGQWSQTNMAYQGLVELFNEEIVCPGLKPHYFHINPRIFFNGNRLVIFESIEKKKFDDLESETPSDGIMEKWRHRHDGDEMRMEDITKGLMPHEVLEIVETEG